MVSGLGLREGLGEALKLYGGNKGHCLSLTLYYNYGGRYKDIVTNDCSTKPTY